METVRSADGTSIAFERSGEGRPLVLVGGAFNDHSSARPLAEVLAPSFTVFAYDRRGRGSSGDTAPYAVAREVEDLAALIAAAGGSTFVYGHSSGATLALEAAAAGIAIDKLAVYEPPYVVDDTRPPVPPDALDRLRGLIAAGRRREAAELFLIECVTAPPATVEAMQQSPMWPSLQALAHTLPYDLAIVGTGDLAAERLAAIAVPTLVMDGGASPQWARNSVAAVAAAIPRATRRTLAGETHSVDPKRLQPLLVEFFV
jgi:pimeloyl-ACP methyl ester carboxylesterase